MKNTVLLVDDDPFVLQVTSILLRSLGHNYILMARNASEALAIWHSHKDEIGRLLTDINMPGLSGDELAAELLQADPDLEACFMSGNPPDLLNSKIPLLQGRNFVQKPFTQQQLGLVLGRTRPSPSSGKERSLYAFASQS